MRHFFYSLILGALCLTGRAAPVIQTTVDESFQYRDTNITEIRDIQLFPDGRIAYGGIGPHQTAGILWPDGAPEWANNHSGDFLSVTRSVSVDAVDGAFFIGGISRYAGDWVVQRIAFGNDIGWTMKADIDGEATKVMLLPDRDILAAGALKVAGNTNVYGLVRLNLEGTRDVEFAYTNTFDLRIENAVVLADGSVVATWLRTNSNLISSEAGRWLRTGERDLAFNGMWAGSLGTNSQVTALEKAPGTNGFVAAVRTEPVGTGGPRFTKLVLFDEFGNGVGWLPESSYIEGTVHAIGFEAVSAGTIANGGYDRILAAGEFSKVGEVACKNLANLTKEGEVAWGFGSEEGPSGPIYALEVQLDGKVLIGGAFTNVSGSEVLGMTRIQGSSAEEATYLYWADAEFRAFEKLGAKELSLMRGGDLDERLTVELTLPLPPAQGIIIPARVEFGPGQEKVVVPVTIPNDSLRESRERIVVGTVVTNERILVTRGQTELVVLDDETPGTLDPVLQIPPMLGLTAFTFQPDGKILFHGSGRNIMRLNPDGTIDPTFITNALPTMGNLSPVIHQALVQPDGKIIVAGTFVTTSFSQYGRNNLARLNSDGTLDLSFDPRLSSPAGLSFAGPLVKAMLLDNDSILIWLERSIRHETASAKIIRLDRFGFVVSQYSSASDYRTNGEWVLTENGELITYSNGQRQLRKFKADRTVDTNFVADASLGSIDDMQLIGDALWIAGDFQNVNSTLQPHLARLKATNGALETTGNLEVNGEVNVVREHGGKIYIGGSFTKVNGEERFRVARLNLDGSLDMSFDPGNGPNRSIGLIEFQVDGKPLVGTGFDRVDGVPTSWYVRLEGDHNAGAIQFVTQRIELSETNQFVTIEVERIGGSSGPLSAELVTVEGSALGGEHFTATNVFVNYADGEFGRRSFRIAIFADPSATGPRTFSVILRSAEDGSELTVLLKDAQRRLVPGTAFLTGGTNGTNDVRDVAVGADGLIYVVGNFASVDGVPATNVVRLREDLTVDTSFALEALLRYESGTPAPIPAVAVRTNGKVILSGDFTRSGDSIAHGLAQANADGSFDDVFNANYNAGIEGGTLESNGELLIQTDDKLVVNSLGAYLRRVNADGGRDATFQYTSVSGIAKMVVGADGGIYCARNRQGLNGDVVRVSVQGGAVQPIISATHQISTLTQPGRINTLAIDKDGYLLIGGDFTHLNRTNLAPRLARVSTNGVVDTNFVAQVGITAGLNARDAVTAIEILASGEILIGGKFGYVDQRMRPTLALLKRDGSLSPDFDPLVQGSGIAEFERAPDGGVVVRGAITSLDGAPVGDIFKLGFANPLPPVAKFLWPTNGAVIGTSDVEREIRVHAFDPDGFIEKAVLELDGVPVATNNSGNVSFLAYVSRSGDHELRLTVTDHMGLTDTESVTFRAVSAGWPGTVAISRDTGEVVITYDGFTLEVSSDLKNWSVVHEGGFEHRIVPGADSKFYRSTH